jgi:hypothetical protein
VGIPNLLHALLKEIHECTLAYNSSPTAIDRRAAVVLKVGTSQSHGFIAEPLARPVLEQARRR